MSTKAPPSTPSGEMQSSTSGPARRFGTSRRAFLAGAGAAALGVDLLADASPALASGGLTKGDAALLRFAAAAEILETDFWQQYNELGGIQDSEVPGGSGSPLYAAALSVLDSDMAQYVHDNTEDEFTHFTFLNAYLEAHGAEPANLDRFKTLPSSKATGAQQIGRLTNLMQLTVDTS
jgi:ferritin-like protein